MEKTREPTVVCAAPRAPEGAEDPACEAVAESEELRKAFGIVKGLLTRRELAVLCLRHRGGLGMMEIAEALRASREYVVATLEAAQVKIRTSKELQGLRPRDLPLRFPALLGPWGKPRTHAPRKRIYREGA